MLTDSQVKEIFFELEERSNVFAHQINGVSLYFILRFPIEIYFREVKAGTTVAVPTHMTTDGLMQRAIKFGKKRLKKVLGKDKERRPGYFDGKEAIKEAPYLFLATCPQSRENGASVDLYDLINHYRAAGEHINFVQPAYDVDVLPRKMDMYDTFLKLDLGIEKELSNQETATLQALINELKDVLKVDFTDQFLNWKMQVEMAFAASARLADYIRISKCKAVFARSVYTEPWVAMATKTTEVKLIEVQHGVIVPDNIYYQSVKTSNFASGKLLMPDTILNIGDKWTDIMIGQGSKFNASNTFTIGTDDFSPVGLRSKEEPLTRIVFFLQGRNYSLFSIKPFIEEFISRCLSTELKNSVDVVVRPHPRDVEEAIELREKYGDFISVEDVTKVLSIESIKSTDIVVSATSMCLYEALAYGKTVVSFPQFAGMICDHENINIVSSVDAFVDIINAEGDREMEMIKYLQPFDPAALEKLTI